MSKIQTQSSARNSEEKITRRCNYTDAILCVCWMVTVAVRGTSCCFFYCLTICVTMFVPATEQKATRPTLWSHESLQHLKPPSETWPKNAHIHLHNTTRDKHCSLPLAALFCPRSLGWWESCYYWQRAGSLLPVEARWLFLLPRVQTLPLQILLLELWNLFRLRVWLEVRESD